MDYEKKYNEALSQARFYYENCPTEPEKKKLENIFPELCESEEERIRKAIVHLLDVASEAYLIESTGFKKEQFLSYLEKQKEQKPAEKQDYSGLNDLERAILRGFLCAGVENVPITIIKETAKECITQMKPAEWSEEDKNIISNICDYLLGILRLSDVAKEKAIVFLHSLCPPKGWKEGWCEDCKMRYNHWKPSEKQMNCLCAAVDAAIRKHNESVSGYEPARVLKSLYEDLQKIR